MGGGGGRARGCSKLISVGGGGFIVCVWVNVCVSVGGGGGQARGCWWASPDHEKIRTRAGGSITTSSSRSSSGTYICAPGQARGCLWASPSRPSPAPRPPPTTRRSGSFCGWGGGASPLLLPLIIIFMNVFIGYIFFIGGGAASPLLLLLIIIFIIVFISYFLLGAARLRRCCCRLCRWCWCFCCWCSCCWC